MHIFTAHEDDMVFEEPYNVSGRRIFPWPEAVEEPNWGGAWVDVAPGATSTPHDHDENEMFFIVEGSGVMRIGDETRRVRAGETVFITPFQDHDLTNDGDVRLRFVTIWWGGSDAVARDRAKWAAEFGITDPAARPAAQNTPDAPADPRQVVA
ncbi:MULTISPECIES: cupin domain-containing protein [unclassified Streptomyces]|uniref:cupin domain-containing protein n=1 Tax=unclassified Streptomyces TaxID=2593676 RepID=UPI002E0FEFA3|nr:MULTISPECIES: cupin domain-containing protein [unclassified Streptomyces]WSR26759.1 cupin domain-containing protein [Streptomyces sp. NBC_01205]